MRFEIKFTKMGKLNNMGIVYLSDLLKPSAVKSIKNLIIEEFEEVCFYDYTIDFSKMKQIEQMSMLKYKNPIFWQQLNSKDKYYHKDRFEKLTAKYSQNLKKKISKLIAEKIDALS